MDPMKSYKVVKRGEFFQTLVRDVTIAEKPKKFNVAGFEDGGRDP